MYKISVHMEKTFLIFLNYLFFIPFFSNFSLQANLVRIELLSHKQNRVILLSDNHNLNISKESKKHLAFIKRLAIKIDELENKSSFCIEVPASFNKLFVEKSDFLTNSKDNIENIKNELLLWNIKIENIEIRNISIAAYMALKDPNNSFAKLNIITGTASCILEMVTFRDLENEFNKYIEMAYDIKKNFSDDKLLEQIEKIIIETKNKFDELKNYLAKNNLKFSDNILDSSKNLILDKLIIRQKLKILVLKTFSSLFNLILFLNINLKLSKFKTIIIIAGAGHCRNVNTMLQCTNWKLVLSEGDYKTCLTETQIENFYNLLKL